MAIDAEPNFEPTTYPSDQPAKEPPCGGEHLPTQPDPTKKPPYQIDDPRPRPLEDDEPGQEKRRAS
jgi:hypothetical protein